MSSINKHILFAGQMQKEAYIEAKQPAVIDPAEMNDAERLQWFSPGNGGARSMARLNGQRNQQKERQELWQAGKLPNEGYTPPNRSEWAAANSEEEAERQRKSDAGELIGQRTYLQRLTKESKDLLSAATRDRIPTDDAGWDALDLKGRRDLSNAVDNEIQQALEIRSPKSGGKDGSGVINKKPVPLDPVITGAADTAAQPAAGTQATQPTTQPVPAGTVPAAAGAGAPAAKNIPPVNRDEYQEAMQQDATGGEYTDPVESFSYLDPDMERKAEGASVSRQLGIGTVNGLRALGVPLVNGLGPAWIEQWERWRNLGKENDQQVNRHQTNNAMTAIRMLKTNPIEAQRTLETVFNHPNTDATTKAMIKRYYPAVRDLSQTT
jgi:hypothetical protein